MKSASRRTAPVLSAMAAALFLAFPASDPAWPADPVADAETRLEALKLQVAEQTQRMEALRKSLAQEEASLGEVRRALGLEQLSRQRGGQASSVPNVTPAAASTGINPNAPEQVAQANPPQPVGQAPGQDNRPLAQ